MKLLNKEPVQRVQRILTEFNSNIEVIELNSSARTALEAASSLGCEVGAIIKSLLFKTEQNFTLCLVAGDKKASLNKIKKILKKKDVFMASANDVKSITGFNLPLQNLQIISIDDKKNKYLDDSILLLFLVLIFFNINKN